MLLCQICLVGRVVFWWSHLGFLYALSYHLQTVTVYFFLSNWMPFVFLSCLIFVARTSNTILNRSGESRHPCLVPDLSGKVFSFYPWSMMLSVGLSYMAFIRFEECSLYSHFAECFYCKWVLYLIKCFFHIYRYDHVIFVFAFLM